MNVQPAPAHTDVSVGIVRGTPKKNMIFSSKQLEIARYYFVAFSQTQAFLLDLDEI
jgi:hypothetical protein